MSGKVVKLMRKYCKKSGMPFLYNGMKNAYKSMNKKEKISFMGFLKEQINA